MLAEDDRAGLIGTIAPGMIRPPLYNRISRLEMNLFGVEDQCDFTLQNITEVEGLGLFHIGVGSIRLIRTGIG